MVQRVCENHQQNMNILMSKSFVLTSVSQNTKQAVQSF